MCFGQLLSGLSLIVGFFKNFGMVIVFSWLFQQLRVDKARNTLSLRWPTVERQNFLAYFIH